MTREHWGSRLTFVLAAAGSAVGLGNIWRFPYLVGQNGGGAFLLLYVLCLLIVGFPLMISEVLVGQVAQRNPVGALRRLSPSRWWVIVGFLGVAAAFIILSFYSVVAGWTIEYVYRTVSGSYFGQSAEEIRLGFDAFVSNYHRPLMWHGIFMLLSIAVVAGGIKGGIERWSSILMPILFFLVLVIIVSVSRLPGAREGYAFLFRVDWSLLANPRVVLEALGQAFFSLSLGMGAMITYGSYLRRDESVPRTTGWILVADTGVAILAGLAIFPAVFSFGFEPSQGPRLVFCTLPAVFSLMEGGRIIGILFFSGLLIAALTSAISLLEVIVSYVVEEWGWRRHHAVLVAGLCAGLAGIPCALSFAPQTAACPLGLSHVAIPFLGGSFGFFDLMEHVASNLLLPLGGLLLAVFVGWIWGWRRAVQELSQGEPSFIEDSRWGRAFGFIVSYVTPVVVTLVLLSSMRIVAFHEGALVFFQGWF